MKMTSITAVLLACSIASPALAQTTQDLAALERRLVIALGADIGQPGGPIAPLDRRMKLATCPSPVTIDPPALGAAVLRCAEIGWRVRVPLVRSVHAPASIESARPVIRRGDPVELAASRRGFTVSTQVIAEQDGAPGQRIRVRAEGRSAPMMVEVVDFGKVRASGFN